MQRPNLENILAIAKNKLNSEALRHRMSFDATLHSPDLISSSRFMYNKIGTDVDSGLAVSRRDSNVSNDTSLHEEPCSGGDHQLEDENLNVRAAIIHVIGDFIQSIGVLLAAIVIKFAVCINTPSQEIELVDRDAPQRDIIRKNIFVKYVLTGRRFYSFTACLVCSGL